MRSILRLGDCVVSLLLCPAYRRPDRQMHWTLNPVPSESKYVTLLCRLNPGNNSVHSFHLFSGSDKLCRCCFTARYLWLLQGERLDRLEDFSAAVVLRSQDAGS